MRQQIQLWQKHTNLVLWAIFAPQLKAKMFFLRGLSMQIEWKKIQCEKKMISYDSLIWISQRAFCARLRQKHSEHENQDKVSKNFMKFWAQH